MAIYATAFWIQVNTLSFLLKLLGADPSTFSFLQTTFSFLQLCGGPIFGKFGDVYGGKRAMQVPCEHPLDLIS